MLTVKKTMKAAILGTFLGLASMGAVAKDNYILAGASPGGLWSLLGAGVDKAMRASYPNATVTYQTSGGGFANAKGGFWHYARCRGEDRCERHGSL